MKNILPAVVLSTLSISTFAQTKAEDFHYVYFANSNVWAYQKVDVKSINSTETDVTLTLASDSVIAWKAEEIDSISSTPPTYAGFSSFVFKEKHNDQIFSDVEAIVSGNEIKATIGAIGKYLTPTFTLDDDAAEAYVKGVAQKSGVSRHRFANEVVYTVAKPQHRRLSLEKVSDEVYSESEVGLNLVRLSAGMLSTNAPTSRAGEGLDMMLDDDPNTFFHSTWSSDSVYEVDLSKQVYIQMKLDKAVSDIKFYFQGRPNSDKYNVSEWKVETSNDGNSWKQVAVIDESDGLPTEGKGVDFTSPTIALGGSYSYLRFTASKVGYKNYLCIAEFELYEVTYGGEPQLIEPARYEYKMMPMGNEVTVAIDWLTDRSAGVPRIDIDIEGGEMVSSKEVYLKARITFQGNGVWGDLQDSVQIKGRGNTSWNEGKPYAKNPYRLKFAKSVKPFGLKKGKNWNLIAQAQKGSLMTNPMAMKAARMVETAAANDMIPVDLYMNGDYRGSYLFTQKVGLAGNSVDVDETAAALYELDRYFDETYKFYSDKYALPVNIKDPDFSDEETMITFEQVQQAFNRFEKAVYDNSHIERMTDMDALTRFMLVNELVANCELGHPKSVFLYRENINHLSSKFTFGPVWDFDWSYNYSDNRLYCSGGETVDILSYQTSRPGNKFFTQLWTASDVVKYQYAQLWKKFNEEHLQELLDYVDDYYAFANQSFKKNGEKWGDGANYDTNVANMKAWFATRVAHLVKRYNPALYPVPTIHGDVNSDGVVNECDLEQLIEQIIQEEAYDSCADMDGDSKNGVSDVAWMCNQIYGREKAIDPERIPNDNGNYVELNIAQGAVANEWKLNVLMSNGDPMIAVGFQLRLPKGFKIKGGMNGIVANERLTAHTMKVAEYMEKNQWNMLAYSPQNDYIAASEGDLMSVILTTDGDVAAGKYIVHIAEVVGVDGNGVEHTMDANQITLNFAPTGIDQVNEDDYKVTYFTSDGLPIAQPQKGMVIGRKIYSDGRVEMKKIFVRENNND